MIYTLRTRKVSPAKLHRAQLHYNPTLVTIGQKLYIIYRCQNGLRSRSWLAVSRLDADYRVLWSKRLTTEMPTAEDPRAVVRDGRVYVFYQSGAHTWPKVLITDYTIRCAMYSLDFNLISDTPLTWVGRRQTEKNWAPFFDEMTRAWYCIYSVNPWRVLKFDSAWRGELIYDKHHNIPWSWGEIRGGSCPLRVLPPEGQFGFGMLDAQYWAWFHSSFMPPKSTKLPRQYVGGLLSFAAEPPFLPTGISTYPVITPDITARTVVNANVSYPAGSTLRNGEWTISAGYGDCQIRMIDVKHDELIDSANFRRLE